MVIEKIEKLIQEAERALSDDEIKKGADEAFKKSYKQATGSEPTPEEMTDHANEGNLSIVKNLVKAGHKTVTGED